MLNFYLAATFVSLVLIVCTSWKTQYWVAMIGVALSMGAAYVFFLREEYFDFSFYLFQILLVMLGSAFFVRGRSQKLLVGITTTVLVAATLAKDSLKLDHLENIEYTVFLYAAYALLPLLFYSPVKEKEESLEKMICYQQTWLRALFFHWSLEQGVNIAHYDLYRSFVVELGSIAAVVILLAVIWRRRFYWTLVQQSVLSLITICAALDQTNSRPQLIYIWILLMALSTLLPKSSSKSFENRTRFLKRLEFGAFGGGVFWSLIFVAQLGAAASLEGAMLWILIIFLLGFFSWLREVPSSAVDERTVRLDQILIGVRAANQVILALVFFYPL